MQDRKLKNNDILSLDFISGIVETLVENKTRGFEMLNDECKNIINSILSGEISKVEWSIPNAKGIVIRKKDDNYIDITYLIRNRIKHVKKLTFEAIEEVIKEYYIKYSLTLLSERNEFSESEMTLFLTKNEDFNELIVLEKNKYIINNLGKIEEQILKYSWEELDKEYIFEFIEKYQQDTFKQIDDFCTANSIDIVMELKLFKIARVHSFTARFIVDVLKLGLVSVSITDIDTILESVKTLYQKNTGFLPYKEGFVSYLLRNGVSLTELKKDNYIKKRIGEYVAFEEYKNMQYYHDGKHKIQALIDAKQPSIPTIDRNREESERRETKPSIRAIALYHFFRIEKGIELPFDKRAPNKTKAIQDLTNTWNIDNRNFRRVYENVNNASRRKNIKYENDYRQAIQLLNKEKHANKEAIILANDELRVFSPLG